jgi:hypothetical protein
MTCINCPDGGQLCGSAPEVSQCPVFERDKEKCPPGWCWVHKHVCSGEELSVWMNPDLRKIYYNEYKPWHENKCACNDHP